MDERHPHAGRQERVFAVGFVAAAPAGIAENVHVGRPEGEPFVNIPVTLGGIGVVLSPAFGGDDYGDLLQVCFIEHGG